MENETVTSVKYLSALHAVPIIHNKCKEVIDIHRPP
jgi:hypothetical protein